ncbi:uncharacterized protein OCT59_000730 [Rhizophagus irregularis]|uniref:uncharacterized protein n=1 Tax=Rhizophagus irregularis TaxID=588596 RepID=UPI00331B8149|nr:hypothetical protein OCT59_000730 [Rhizophagus irregularis]
MPRMRSKKLPGLRNGRLRRRTSKWTLETRSKDFEMDAWDEGLRNERLRQEGMLPEVFYIKMFIIIPFFCRNAV